MLAAPRISPSPKPATLPWLTRKQSQTEVRISTRASRLPTGVMPARKTEEAIAVIAQAFPDAIETIEDVLSGALMNAGPIIHPPLILMNAGPNRAFRNAWEHPQRGHPAGDPPGAHGTRQ